MNVLCVFGRYNYGNPARGESHEYSNFIPALRQLGHDVDFFDSRTRRCHQNFADLNRSLLQTVERCRPDVILSVQSLYEVWLETWKILLDAGGAATIGWATDDSWKYTQASRFLAPAFHGFATTCPRSLALYQRDNLSNVLLTQWAANSNHMQPPLASRECRHQVSFVGSISGQRSQWIDALRTNGVDVTCFGYGWPNGVVKASQIPQIIRDSVISLNDAAGFGSWARWPLQDRKQIKARTFEVPGAGGFLLTEYAPCLEQYYAIDSEIAVFRDLDTLIDKVQGYLTHPKARDAVSLAGYERTHREHTYEHRMHSLLTFAIQQRDLYFVGRHQKPTGEIDWTFFREVMLRHKLTPAKSWIRRLLTAAGSTVWGVEKGPRAARRLLFEASWRIAGAKTYSAAGWPGRMFYEES